jgi:hypothetical protein
MYPSRRLSAPGFIRRARSMVKMREGDAPGEPFGDGLLRDRGAVFEVSDFGAELALGHVAFGEGVTYGLAECRLSRFRSHDRRA